MPGSKASRSCGRRHKVFWRAEWKSVCRGADIVLTWPAVDGSEKRFNRQRFLNANKYFAICDAIIATAKLRAGVSR
jgi:hypothetical protein